MTEEYLYKACTSCGKGTKGKDIVHTWDCPNNPRNIEEKPMTYEQAREKVAHTIQYHQGGISYWYSNLPAGENHKYVLELANDVLAALLTPQVLEEWKKGGSLEDAAIRAKLTKKQREALDKGGELVVTDSDQSFLMPSDYEQLTASKVYNRGYERGYKSGVVDTWNSTLDDNFRKVVTQQSGAEK